MVYEEVNNLSVILIFGALFLLTYLTFLNPLKVNKKGNIYFGIFLLLYASFWLEEVVALSGFKALNHYLLSAVHGLQIFTPLFFYFSIVFYTNPQYIFKKKDFLHFIIPMGYFTFHIVRLIDVRYEESLRIPSIILMLFQAVLYVLLSYLIIKKHQKRILKYSSNITGISLNWLVYIIIQIFILSVVFIFHNIFVSTRDLSLFANLMQLITVYFIAFHLFTQKEIFPVREKQRQDLFSATSEEVQEEKKKIVSDEDLELLKSNLLKCMVEKEPYLENDINLVRLAETLSISAHQLSYIINTGFNENFFQFINRYRVNKAKNLLQKGDEKMTMLAIAFDSGFNSKTTFNTTFKKITNQTPSEFRKKRTDL